MLLSPFTILEIFRGNKRSRMTYFKKFAELTFAKKSKNAKLRNFLPAKVSSFKVMYVMCVNRELQIKGETSN